MFECEICGKTVKKRGRAGHYRFSTGEHGPKNELPEGWSENFREVESDTESEGNGKTEPQADSSDSDSEDSDTSSQSESQSESESEKKTGIIAKLNRTLFST